MTQFLIALWHLLIFNIYSNWSRYKPQTKGNGKNKRHGRRLKLFIKVAWINKVTYKYDTSIYIYIHTYIRVFMYIYIKFKFFYYCILFYSFNEKFLECVLLCELTYFSSFFPLAMKKEGKMTVPTQALLWFFPHWFIFHYGRIYQFSVWSHKKLNQNFKHLLDF